jgi:hypothetical protein
MIRRAGAIVMTLLITAASAAAAEGPQPAELVERMIGALGGEAFRKLGVLELQVAEEEIRNDGATSENRYSAWIDTANLMNLRMELPGEIVVARGGGEGWATTAGVFDDRPQTPGMASRTLNQSLFPLLIPYSLEMEGVWLKEVAETTWEGREAWALLIPFAKGFFVNPVLNTTWRVVVDKEDASILAADFVPSAEYRDVQPMGVRYRYLKYEELDGARVPTRILAVGINFEGQESGATRVTRLSPSVYGPWNPRLFISPARLEALEGEE